MNIMQTAAQAGSFKTLATAINAAGINVALDGTGPFTLFAPTDDAFAKLPSGKLEKLLEPANKEKLAEILSYHVIRGSLSAAEVGKLTEAKTLHGQMLPISNKDGLRVHGAGVTSADVKASNGMIHGIDAVLLP